MFRITSTLVLLGLSAPLGAQEATQLTTAETAEVPPPEPEALPPLFVAAAGVDLDSFRWTARPVIVFADSPEDPAFQRQIKLLMDREAELRERDIIVLTDTDPDAGTDIRLKLRPRGFMMALIGKDGGVKLRKPLPWSVRDLTRVIDKMPMRQQEINDRRATGS